MRIHALLTAVWFALAAGPRPALAGEPTPVGPGSATEAAGDDGEERTDELSPPDFIDLDAESPAGRADAAGRLRFEPGIFYRISAFHLSDFPLSADSPGLPRRDWGAHLLRISPRLTVADVEVRLSFDLPRGVVWGDLDTEAALFRPGNDDGRYGGTTARSFRLRELSITWRGPAGELRAGVQPAAWGMGLVASSGEDDPERFGETWHGDYAARVLFATKPLLPKLGPGSIGDRLIAAVAFDLVVEDENARLYEGDLAVQGVLSALYRSEPVDAGLYTAFRYQLDHDGDRLKAFLIDAWLRAGRRIDAGWTDLTPRFEAEGALLTGTTDRLRATWAAGGLSLLSYGGAARASLEVHRLGVKPSIEAGFASGDADPYDGSGAAFSFDADWRAGIILFGQLLKAITDDGVSLLADPSRSRYPSKGLDLLPTEGRVTNAAYLFPTLVVSPGASTRLLAGALFAWSAAPFSHPYRSYRAGGPANPYGVNDPPRYLGTEIDVGFRHWWDWGYGIRTLLRAEAGVFLPGPAFRLPDGSLPDPVTALSGGAGLEWR